MSSVPTIPATHLAGPGYYELREAEAARRAKQIQAKESEEKDSPVPVHYSVYGLFNLLKEKPDHAMAMDQLRDKMRLKECLPEVIRAFQFLVDAKKIEEMATFSKLLLDAKWKVEQIKTELLPRVKWEKEGDKNQFVTKALASVHAALKAKESLQSSGVQRQSNAAKSEERSRFLQELNAIQSKIDSLGMKDEMTDQISRWVVDYKEALNTHEDEPKIVLEKFILRLQELLKDPSYLTSTGSLAPLDDKALLGSDGRTYNYMAYSFFLVMAKGEFRERSPLAHNNPAPFTVSDHHVVRMMIKWLKDKDAQLRCEEMEKIYQELALKHALPVIATNEHERRRQRILARAAQIESEKEAKKQAEAAPLMARVQAYARQRFDVLRQEAQANFEKNVKRIDALSQNDRDRIELQERAIANLEQRTEELKREREQLEKRKKELDDAIVEANRGLVSLGNAINEAREAIKERDKAWVKEIFVAAAIMGGCILSTYAIGAYLASYGVTVKATVYPMSAGAGLAVRIPN